ncbi:MAG: hypothetical protein Q9M20_06340 [Mariprofundaceae bacterium]|nr:hypothetical protein [Mariprofundaceae bacterium]
MNRRDDRAEALFATNFFAMSAVAMHTVDWQRIRCGQMLTNNKGASEGAAAFVNNAG